MEYLQHAVSAGELLNLIFVILFLLFFIVLLFYKLQFILRVAYCKEVVSGNTEPVSILMTTMNDESALAENLPPVLDSENAAFEVVTVDNCSQDQSLDVLSALKKQFPMLRISLLKQQIQNSEKMAQNIALKAAQYEWVNYIPVTATIPGKNWVHDLSSRLNKQNESVVHYSNVIHSKGFYQQLYRLELLYQQIKSFGFLLKGIPFVFSQDNVVFKKQQYFMYDGYRGFMSEPFAKLELVINNFIRKAPASVNFSADTSIVRNEKIGWKDYLELIKKEDNIRKFLPAGIRILLLLVEWSYILFIPLAILLILSIPPSWPFVLAAIVVLVSVHVVIIKKIQVRLKDSKLFLPSLTLGLIMPYIKLFYRISFFRYGSRKEWRIGN